MTVDKNSTQEVKDELDIAVDTSAINGSTQSKFETINLDDNPEIATKNQNDNATGKDGTRRTNKLIQLIEQHYRSTPQKKSEKQLQSEEWLIRPFIKFNRWYSMPAAFIPHFCCGSVYAWSVFNKPIDEFINGTPEAEADYMLELNISSNSSTGFNSSSPSSSSSASLVPVTFYIALGFLGISGAIFGPWLERNGPRSACLLGTCLFFAGQMLTALALFLKQLWLVLFGYGVIGGLGLGLCYISPVSTLQKWFMDKRGLAGGFAVCGFGSGSIAMAKIQALLIQSVGVHYTFIILGCSYFVCMVPAALSLRTPPPGYNALEQSNSKKPPTGTSGTDNDKAEREEDSDQKCTLIEAITSKTYRLMYVMFFAHILFGLVMISRLSNMVTDLFSRSVNEAASVVAINGGFNLAGRLVFSSVSDFIGRKNSYVLMFSTQLVVVGTFSIITSTGTYWAFLLAMMTMTFCYGAGFGTIPAFLTDKFGSSNIGACHGIILTAWSLTSILGGMLFTAVFDKIVKNGQDGHARDKSDPFPYNVNTWWMFGVVLLGWIAAVLVPMTKKDRIFINKLKSVLCCCKT